MNKIVTAAAVVFLAIVGFNLGSYGVAEYKFTKMLKERNCTLMYDTGKPVVVEGLSPQVSTYKPKIYKCESFGPNVYLFAD